MVLDALGIIVLIFIIIGVIKLLFFIFSPGSWFGFSKKLYSSPAVLVTVQVILAAIVFYYLLQTLTIVQIMGGVVLGVLLTGLSFAFYSKEMMALAAKIYRQKNILKKTWLIWVIWLALFVWTLTALF